MKTRLGKLPLGGNVCMNCWKKNRLFRWSPGGFCNRRRETAEPILPEALHARDFFRIREFLTNCKKT